MNPRPPRLDLNPSSAERWTTCTASPAFILENHDKLPPSGSRFSEEGTTAHAVAAALLLDQSEPKDTPTPIDVAMRQHGWNYMEYVLSLQEKQSLLLVEQKLELWYMQNRHAIVDAAVINPLALHVVDYKYGEGVPVHPENNLQAVIYAYSVGKGQQLADDHPVFIHIYQPRGRSATQPEQVWETTWGVINTMAYDIECLAKMIITPTVRLEFKPSEKACQWCPAKGFCEARRASMLDGIDALATIEDKPKPLANTLSLEQRVMIERYGDEIIKWVKDVQGYNLEQMVNGNSLPGFKLVMSRGGNRYWTDSQLAAKLLLEQTHLRREEVIEEKVIGPAGAEKLLGKKSFGQELTNLIDRPPGKPEVVEEGDKRAAISENALADFSSISDSTPE